MRTAAARAHGARTLSPRAPRRVSGPVARPRSAPPVQRPRTASPAQRPRTAVRAAPARLTASGLLDRLLRGRAWIWVIGVALMGIVAMQVSLLKLNTGISRAVQSATTLERANARLESRIAKLSSNERISRVALSRGMVAPPAGSVVYVRARPDSDAQRAAREITPPSDEARQVAASPPVPTPAPGTSVTAPTPGAVTAPAPGQTDPAGVAAVPTPGQG